MTTAGRGYTVTRAGTLALIWHGCHACHHAPPPTLHSVSSLKAHREKAAEEGRPKRKPVYPCAAQGRSMHFHQWACSCQKKPPATGTRRTTSGRQLVCGLTTAHKCAVCTQLRPQSCVPCTHADPIYHCTQLPSAQPTNAHVHSETSARRLACGSPLRKDAVCTRLWP